MPNWTKEQSDAINKDGTNIIVSAGAGSGKTAVLSERVLRKLKEGIKMKEKELERLTKLKEIEKDLRNKGFNKICGIDEAGRGPLAGPVVVAGVIMPENSMIEGVNDSKKVSEKKRERLYDVILEEAISYSVAIIGQDVIDDINILNATKQGVTQVVEGLDVRPDLIVVDALTRYKY